MDSMPIKGRRREEASEEEDRGERTGIAGSKARPSADKLSFSSSQYVSFSDALSVKLGSAERLTGEELLTFLG